MVASLLKYFIAEIYLYYYGRSGVDLLTTQPFQAIKYTIQKIVRYRWLCDIILHKTIYVSTFNKHLSIVYSCNIKISGKYSMQILVYMYLFFCSCWIVYDFVIKGLYFKWNSYRIKLVLSIALLFSVHICFSININQSRTQWFWKSLFC